MASGGVAACARNQTRCGNLGAVKFGQPVDGFGLQIHRRMRLAIPCFIIGSRAQPEICRKINDLQIARQGRDDNLRRGMRQRAKAQINLREINLFDLLQPWQIKVAQKRKYLGHRHAGFAIRRKRCDLHAGVAGDQTHQLCPSIARCAKNCDAMGHVILRANLVADVALWGMGCKC
mgnify:CR=1 FL=1